MAAYEVAMDPTVGETSWRLHPSCFAALRQAHRESESTSSDWFRFRGRNATNRYYRRHIEMLDGFTEMDALHERLMQPSTHEETLVREQEERAKLAARVTFAIRITNMTNLALFVAKVFVSIQSKSLAIIASALDSLLDLLSGFILWFTAHSMSKTDQYKYPIGKRRMQPLGIIVFACVMAMLGFQVLVEAARQVAGKEHSVSMHGWGWTVSIMLSVTFVKAVLLVYSLTFKNEIIRAYAKDHFFDVVTNTIGLAAYLLANWLVWWIDPAGAVVLSLYTIHNWGRTVLENVNSLVGRTAPPEYLQKLTYLCWNHHKDILQIDTVRAYTFGSHYFTEVDIVLPATMPLHEAHDIGEALQEKLESLPEIERAFVHLDYEVGHRPEHGGPQGLIRSSSIRAAGDESPAATPSAAPSTNAA